MNALRSTLVLIPVASAIALFATGDVRAQKRFTLSEGTSIAQYLREHALDVDDTPGHQIRVYELRYEYPKKDYVLAGVVVQNAVTRGMSDYINGSGAFTTYSVYTMEDGSKVLSRSSGTTQTSADGTRRFTFVETFTGGTGKFKGIRGQRRGSGERAAGANTVSQKTSGEYWIEE